MANFYIKFDDIQHIDPSERNVLFFAISKMQINDKSVTLRINDFLNEMEVSILPLDIKYALSELQDAGILDIHASLDGLDPSEFFEIEFSSDSVIQKNHTKPRKKRK